MGGLERIAVDRPARTGWRACEAGNGIPIARILNFRKESARHAKQTASRVATMSEIRHVCETCGRKYGFSASDADDQASFCSRRCERPLREIQLGAPPDRNAVHVGGSADDQTVVGKDNLPRSEVCTGLRLAETENHTMHRAAPSNSLGEMQRDQVSTAVDQVEGLEKAFMLSTGLQKRGRKRKQESRADELRLKLIAWKAIPESLRPSLRALAAETRVSHQLLSFFLKDLEEWQFRDRYRKAKERALEKAKQISARAATENRDMTMRECLDVIVVPGELDQIEDMRQRAKRGPLHRLEFKILELWAKQGFTVAQELLLKRAQIGVKPRKRFEEIVRETPRIEDETSVAWIRRIWDECKKYETNCPSVLDEELLQRLSRPKRKVGTSNLPVKIRKLDKPFRFRQTCF